MLLLLLLLLLLLSLPPTHAAPLPSPPSLSGKNAAAEAAVEKMMANSDTAMAQVKTVNP